MEISQIQLVSDIMGLLETYNPNGEVNTRQYNAVIKAANIICEEVRKPTVSATQNISLESWAMSDDVGMSSKFLAFKLSGVPSLITDYALPYDVDDFSRCYKLIKSVPDLKNNFQKLAAEDASWQIILTQWDALQEFYESENWSEIQCVLDDALKVAGRR